MTATTDAPPRVWVNTSKASTSFVDYTAYVNGAPCVFRQIVGPGVGIRLPKDTISVEKAGKDMKEGRAE